MVGIRPDDRIIKIRPGTSAPRVIGRTMKDNGRAPTKKASSHIDSLRFNDLLSGRRVRKRDTREEKRAKLIWPLAGTALLTLAVFIAALILRRRGGDGGEKTNDIAPLSIEDALWYGVNKKRLRNILQKIVDQRFGGDRIKAAEAVEQFDILSLDDFFKRQSITPLRGFWRWLTGLESGALLGHEVHRAASSPKGWGLSEREATELTAQWSIYQAGGWMRAGWRVNVQRLSIWFSTLAESIGGNKIAELRGFKAPHRLIVRTVHQLEEGLEPLHTFALITHLAAYWDYKFGHWYSRILENDVGNISDFETYGKKMEDVVLGCLLYGNAVGAVNGFQTAGSVFHTLSAFDSDSDVKIFKAFHDLAFASLIKDALPQMDEGSKGTMLERAHRALENAQETFSDPTLMCYDFLSSHGLTHMQSALQSYTTSIAQGLPQMALTASTV